MVATGVQIQHESNFQAESQVEVVVGADRIVRVNIDGRCALRIRMTKGCEFQLTEAGKP
jgi:hypothetical protein